MQLCVEDCLRFDFAAGTGSILSTTRGCRVTFDASRNSAGFLAVLFVVRGALIHQFHVAYPSMQSVGATAGGFGVGFFSAAPQYTEGITLRWSLYRCDASCESTLVPLRSV